MVQELWYLGLGISPDGMFISDMTKEAIRNWEIPKPGQRNKKGNRAANPDGKTSIRTFLGMVSFFRKFIPRLSERAKPIYDLLDSKASFADWNYTHDMAFLDLQDALLSSDVLQIPNSRLPFVIYPDASGVGVGGVLMQDQGEGLKPCAYISSKLSKAMTRRGAYETELWAMIKCLQVWKHYLHGTSVEIRTDHAPLKYFHTQGKLTDKIVRWLDFLSEFDFTVTHIPGESNMAADCFSRNPRFYKEDPFWKEHLEKIKASCVSMSSCEVISFLGAKKYQYRSGYLMAIRATSNISTRSSHARQLTQWMESVKASYPTDEFTKRVIDNINEYANYEIINGILYKTDSHYGLRMYVPESAEVVRNDGVQLKIRAQIIYESHDTETAGHQGFYRSLQGVFRNFWWLSLRREMYSHVQSCRLCQKAKRRVRQTGIFKGRQIPERKWQDVSFDFITDLPLTKSGNNAIHVIMDQTSRRVRLDACNMTITSLETAKLVFNTLIRDHGVPRKIISDRDVRFTAAVWTQIWKLLGTKLSMSNAYDPLTNAANERSHAVIEDMLRTYVTDVSEWDTKLAIIEFAINNQPNIDTGRTPFELDTGQHPLDPLTVCLDPSDGILANWNQAILEAIDAYKKAQERRLQIVNSRRWAPNFEAGDYVYMSTEFLTSPEGQKRGRKLRFRWAGPFKVISMSQNELAAELEFSDIQTGIHNWIPVNRLKLAHADSEQSQSSRIHNRPPQPEYFDDTHFYEVESLINRRWRRKHYEFLVKFVGYDYQSNEWLPERDLSETCQELVDSYNMTYPKL